MISVCMIAKNEEKWIGECIAHLKALASEIIVVDTGSSDRTMEIAREQGARVSQVKWENDFAKARNASLDKATQKWILIIDPDERIANSDMLAIKKLCELKDAAAYSFNTRNYSQNPMASGFQPCVGAYAEEKEYPGYFESRKVRLFQNLPGVRFVGSVHELVESTLKGKVVESDIPFHHYGSTKEEDVAKNKRSFYQAQGLKKAKENPGDWKAFFELGVEYLTGGEPQRAWKELERSAQLKPRDVLVLSNLGFAYMESGKYDLAERTLKECLQVDPNYHDALLNLGVTQMRREKWQEAIAIFDQLIKKHPRSFLAFRNCGLCFAHQRKFKEAARCFEEAIKRFPNYTEAKIDLGITAFMAGRPDIAKPILEQAVREDPNSLRAKATLEDIRKNLEQRARSQSR